MAPGSIMPIRSRASCTCCLLAIVVIATMGLQKARAQQFPFGTLHQAYRPGTLFPTNFTRPQQNAHVAAYYDYWKARWLKPDPEGNGWRVISDSSGKTVSEGQGYGMVIVPLMAGHDPQAKNIFDGLWQFRLAHPSSIDNRLMDWNVPEPTGNDSAFDGDADIAYGLLLAHAQWGSGGTINYLAEARNVIAGIRAKTIGPTSKLPMLGDWVNPTSSSKFNQWATRSSDFMLGHFRAYGAATNDPAYWSSVVTAVQNVVMDLQANESAATGILPDFIQLVGTARDPQPAILPFLEGDHDDDYWYNAGRDPWRLGVDAVLNNDPVTLAQVQKINQWIRTSTGGNANNVRGGYQLNGTPLNSWQDHFFIAPFAVSAMTGTTTADQTWLNNLYARVYQAHSAGNYYADAVALQSLLAVTGNMWDPMAVLARVSGDYNRDGSINMQDYNVWRAAVGMNASASPIADGNGDGVIDSADYIVWRKNYIAGGAGQENKLSTVPEPLGPTVLFTGVLPLAAHWAATRRGARRAISLTPAPVTPAAAVLRECAAWHPTAAP